MQNLNEKAVETDQVDTEQAAEYHMCHFGSRTCGVQARAGTAARMVRGGATCRRGHACKRSTIGKEADVFHLQFFANWRGSRTGPVS